VTGYIDLSRRTRLVDQAEMALRRMQRDIRHALPNSIPSVNNVSSISLETTIDGGRYRRYPGGGGDILDFAIADDSFEMLSAPSQNTWDSLDDGKLLDVVVYNTSPATTGNRHGITGINNPFPYIVSLESGKKFPLSSPQQRFFILDRNESSVTYSCTGGNLTRNADLLTRNVNSCSFSYDPGASQRAGLVTLQISLTEEGETITLLHQVHVVNVP
jgi:MSHA biogenesis protein MshO